MANYALGLYRRAHAHALLRGTIVADTKFEFGTLEINPSGSLVSTVMVGDEILTPDSSRFWGVKDWEDGQADNPPHAPNSYDKQPVREWGKGLGIHKLNPDNPEEMAWVHRQVVPEELIATTAKRYATICERLTDQTPDQILSL